MSSTKTESPKPKPKISDHPAVQTYRDVFHTYPQVGMYADIVDQVGDLDANLELWRECCKYWLGAGWNPKNIDGQLERYRELNVPGDVAEPTPQVIDGVGYLVHPDGTRELIATESE